MSGWDATRVKVRHHSCILIRGADLLTTMQSQLRRTAQRLGQVQYKLDAQGQITGKDIAILLQQGNVALARAKAQKLVREDIYGDLLQTLEMLIGVISEHVGEMEHR